eukprot:COSAG06_NODE_3404_length_5394_cov_6.648914_4_plen_119_part_00
MSTLPRQAQDRHRGSKNRNIVLSQAAYWATAIPKFMAESRRSLQSPAAVKATRLPRQIKVVTPLTAEETREEHARSEAAIAEVEASAGVKNGVVFHLYLYKCHHVTKTGSGETFPRNS